MATSDTFGSEDNSFSSPSRETTTNSLSRFPENLLSESYEEWVDPPSGNDLECVACRLGRLREPVQTPCGQIYCRGCILRLTRDAGRVNNERLDGHQMPDHNETEVEELESRFNFASRSSEGPRPTMNEDLTWESRALNIEQTGSEQQQAEINGLRGLVNELQGICEQKQTEVDEWRGSCEQKQTEIDEWRGSCEQKQTEIDGLRETVNELTGSCEQKQTEIDGLRSVVNELTDSCEQQQTEIDGLRGTVNELTGSCEQKQTQIDGLRGTVNELTGSCEQKQTEIDGLRGTVNELTGSCQQEQTEIEGLRGHSNGLD